MMKESRKKRFSSLSSFFTIFQVFEDYPKNPETNEIVFLCQGSHCEMGMVLFAPFLYIAACKGGTPFKVVCTTYYWHQG